MEEDIVNAFSEMIKTAQENEQNLFDYEVLKIFYSEKIGDDHKVELLIVYWKKNKSITLECRNMYYNKKSKVWKMGKRASITGEVFKVIENNMTEIKKHLCNYSP